MIAIEVLETPDANAKAAFRFFKNDLYIGHKSGDLLISDPELLASHLMIEIVENELLIHPQKGVTHFLINGKRATTIRKVKIGESIGIGTTTFKVTEFSLTPDLSKKTYLNQKLARLIDANSPSLPVIEKISAMIK